MEHYTDILIEEYLAEEDFSALIDKEAANKFYSALKSETPYIDAESFHKAYDKLIREAGLIDIFNWDAKSLTYGFINGKYHYKEIKECPNTYASNVLKKLWAAQYVDNLKSKAQLEQIEKEAEEKHQKELDYENSVDTLKAEKEAEINSLKPAAVQKLENEEKELIDTYLSLLDEKIAIDDLFITETKIEIDNDKNSRYRKPPKFNGYALKIKDGTWYRDGVYDISVEKLVEIWTRLLNSNVKDKTDHYIDNKIKNDLSKYSKLADKVNQLYFIDKDYDVYRTASEKDSSRWSNNEFSTLEKYDSNGKWEKVSIKDYPNFDDLKLIAAFDLIKNNSNWSKTWTDTLSYTYYDPKISKSLGNICGITYEQDSNLDAAWGTKHQALPDDKILPEAKALGLTAGEAEAYSWDSGD